MTTAISATAVPSTSYFTLQTKAHPPRWLARRGFDIYLTEDPVARSTFAKRGEARTLQAALTAFSDTPFIVIEHPIPA